MLKREKKKKISLKPNLGKTKRKWFVVVSERGGIKKLYSLIMKNSLGLWNQANSLLICLKITCCLVYVLHL